MKNVAVQDLFFRVEVEPALSAFLEGPRVPADGQGLVAAAGERDQVLLKGVHPEGVGDLVLVQRTIGSVGPHEEPVVLPVEGGGHAVVRESTAPKVTEYCRH